MDDELLRRLRAGDEMAFDALFREHYDSLCRFAARYVDDARAEELVQDLFAHLWDERARLDVRGGARAYLLSAVRNRALNLRRRDRVETDWEDAEAVPDVRELHARPIMPDAALVREESAAAVRAALASLPERCRLVMHLRWQEQLGYAEIAEVMGISVKGVENQLSRGLGYLRDRLGGN